MLTDLIAQADALRWLTAPTKAAELAEELLPLATKAAYVTADFPPHVAVWYSPPSNTVYVELGGYELSDARMDKLGAELGATSVVPTILAPRDALAVRIAPGSTSHPHYKAAEASGALVDYLASTGLLEASEGLSKVAANMQGYSTVLRGLGEAAGYLPGGPNSWEMPGTPRNLQGMLGGGLIGAGLGYGAGWLGSQVLPDSWDKGKLKRNATLAGAGVGALPGVASVLANYSQGKPLGEDGVFQAPPPDAWTSAIKAGQLKEAADALQVELPAALKHAVSQTGVDEFDLAPMAVPVDHFTNIIWGDPRVAGTLSIQQRAAASGLVNAALIARQNAGGDATRVVYPSDIARIAAGMGSGYLSGAIVGKVLGELVGLPDQTQERLKSVGMWGGVVANVLPLVFGR